MLPRTSGHLNIVKGWGQVPQLHHMITLRWGDGGCKLYKAKNLKRQVISSHSSISF